MKNKASRVILLLIVPFTVLGKPLPARCDEKAQLVAAWKAYFQNMHSLQFNYKTVFETHPDAAAVGTTLHMKFVLDGLKFRNEVTLPKSDKGISLIVRTYDGKYYQNLTAFPNDVELIYHKTLQDNLPYGDSLPILDVFDFAFRKTDISSIETLQKPETWDSVADRIIKIEKATKDGRNGRIVTIQGQAKYELYEVFVEDATFFPWSLTKTAKKATETGEQYLQFIEIKTVRAKMWRAGDKALPFPLRVERKQLRSNKLFIYTFDEVVPETLQINQPVKPEIFTIPRSQATIFTDYDKQKQRAAEYRKRSKEQAAKEQAAK